jgi:hypothetical protein
MLLLQSVTIAAHLTIPVINTLFHGMNQRSQRPRRCTPCLLLKGVLLAIVVMDRDVMVVVVAVRMTVPILWASGGLKVVTLLPVLIHLQVLELRREKDCMMNCKLCEWNDTHMSKYHSEWNQYQSTFCLPVTDVFWSRSGKAPSVEKGPTSAPAKASYGFFSGRLSRLINCYKTETEDGAFASFLNDSMFC